MDPKRSIARGGDSLYERVVTEFAELPLDHPGIDDFLPGRPKTLGGSARMYLDELKCLSVGQPAPEIAGIDLDGKPMKLSEYRGKVVALYFVGFRVLNNRSPITAGVRDVANRHAGEPFALVGVVTQMPTPAAPEPKADREVFKKALASSGMPARFWFDPEQDGTPGPIQTAWNASVQVYLIDHRGVIRHKNLVRGDLLEIAARGC